MRTRQQVGDDILATAAAERLAVLVNDKDAEQDAADKLDELYAEYLSIPQPRKATP